VLKRYEDAVRGGNSILAVVRGTAMNNDGAGSSFGTPHAAAQEMVIRTALNVAGVRPSEVSYVEAHGTGTSVGGRDFQIHILGFIGENSTKRHWFMPGQLHHTLMCDRMADLKPTYQAPREKNEILICGV